MARCEQLLLVRSLPPNDPAPRSEQISQSQLSGEGGRALAITGGPARFIRLRPQLRELAEGRSDSSTPHWSRTTGSLSRA
jgi:hypothetical protein